MQTKLLCLASAAIAVFAAGATSANAYNKQILDDYGNTYSSYDSFFTGQGDNVSQLFHDFGSTNLSGDRLVITSIPNGFSAGEIANLVSYVDGGGRLVLASEGGAFTNAISATNSVLSALGSSIVNDYNGYDPGYNTTTNIVADPFTAGVSSIEYGYTSGLSGGTPLVYGVSGQDIVAYQKIGLGYVFAISDSNLADNLSNPAVSNGQLFLNFESVSSGVPEPSTWAMMALGFAGLGFAGYRSRKAVAIAA